MTGDNLAEEEMLGHVLEFAKKLGISIEGWAAFGGDAMTEDGPQPLYVAIASGKSAALLRLVIEGPYRRATQ